jgi:putative transport protein
MDAIRVFLEQQPLLSMFLVIALGYAAGEISLRGFSLGIGAVLFVGLAAGVLAPRSAPPAMLGSLGLVMFVYGIGIQYGRQFFAGLRGDGLKWNALGAVGVLASLAVAVGAIDAFDLSPAHALGLFAGSLTSTPTLQAAIDVVGDRSPAIGYSVAYPGGVIIPILCLFLFSRLVQARLAPPPSPPTSVEVVLAPDRKGMTVSEVIAALPPGVHLVAVRHGTTNKLPDPQIRLDAGDVLLLFGEPGAIDQARQQLGRAEPGRLASDRSALDIARFFISKAALTGVPIGQIAFPEGVDAKIVEVRRGDAVLLADAGLVLEFGDRVAVIASRTDFPVLRKYFGDSIKSTTEVSYISVGLGMSLGVLLGLVQFPIPGIGTFSMGLAGGPLVVALILGRLGRTGPLSWYVPLPASLTLRTFGLTLFLAAVGLGSGAPFVQTLGETGFTLLVIGLAVVLAAMLVGFLVGHFVLRMATDDLLGVAAGMAGNPAILVFANKTLPSDRVDAGYATIFPSLTIFKILCAQIALGVLK